MNKIESFDEKAVTLFKPKLEQFGYYLDQIKTIELNGQKWATHHYYINSISKRKIVLKQEPYYTDYGFSFSIYNTTTNEYNILCNVPHEDQDREDHFLNTSFTKIFSNTRFIELINGGPWKYFNPTNL